MCREALSNLKIPILGCIPKNSELDLESRHLGLIPVAEQTSLENKIKKIAKTLVQFIEIDKIIQISRTDNSLSSKTNQQLKKSKTTIAVALDKSFNFYYYDNFDSLRRNGARIEFFSPISDKSPPECSGIYIGGGFPEVLGKPLAQNQSMKKSIKKFAEQGMPIYAECGGLMYLTKSIEYNTKKYSMVGFFDASTSMEKKMTLNYTRANVISNCVIAKNSTKLFGHEFHYSELNSLPKDAEFAYELSLGIGIWKRKDGLIDNNKIGRAHV